MINLCTKFDTCVLCDSKNLVLAFGLKDSPLAENYTRERIEQEKFPLELYLCMNCRELQLLHAINQRYLFENYSYQSQSSPGLTQHFAEYAKAMIERLSLKDGDLIVDIGSNDGTFLYQFKALGINSVIGVEPSRQLCVEATKNGVDSFHDFFGYTAAEQIKEKFGPAKLITANNVFAHSRYLDRMLQCIDVLLDKNGTFVIEVSYLPLMMKNMVFDFIYHEHLCYHRFKPLQRFFQSHNFRIIKVETTNMKGGSARFTIVRSGSERQADVSVHDAVILENDMQLDEMKPYREFFHKIVGIKYKIKEMIEFLHEQGRSIVGYGASATTTTLLHYFEIGQHLHYLVDDNQSRIGLYSPGYNLEVKPVDTIYSDEPDYIFITAWRFAKQIMKAHPSYRGKFIIPFPELQIIENNELCDQIK